MLHKILHSTREPLIWELILSLTKEDRELTWTEG